MKQELRIQFNIYYKNQESDRSVLLGLSNNCGKYYISNNIGRLPDKQFIPEKEQL